LQLAKIEKQIWNELEKIEDVAIKELKKNYTQTLDSIRQELANIYEKYAKDGKLTKAQMTKYNRLSKLKKRLNDILTKELRGVGDTLKTLQRTQYEESFFRHSWALDRAVEANIDWGTINEKAAAQSVKRFEDPSHDFYETAIKDLKDSSKRRVQRDITQGIIRGDSYDKMAKRISKTMSKSLKNSMRIARTEGQRAAVEGQQSKYAEAKEKGVPVTEIWDATNDSRTRPKHGALDGKEKQDKGWYVPGIGWIPGPLQSGVASFDINCRCRIRGKVVDIEEPTFASERARQAYEPETYPEWAKRKGIKENKYGQAII